MELENRLPETLWRYYQKGYHTLVRSGLYFRQVLRPALSHVYFKRAVPLLIEYARANQKDTDLPPGFGDQMEACPLTPRDLLHMDYAICLGYAEVKGHDPQALGNQPVLEWPGAAGSNGIFIAADAAIHHSELDDEDPFNNLDNENDDDEDEGEDGGGESKPPFDL